MRIFAGLKLHGHASTHLVTNKQKHLLKHLQGCQGRTMRPGMPPGPAMRRKMPGAICTVMPPPGPAPGLSAGGGGRLSSAGSARRHTGHVLCDCAQVRICQPKGGSKQTPRIC